MRKRGTPSSTFAGLRRLASRFALNAVGLDTYAYACRPLWRCKGCRRQFSLTSGTLFHSRKLPVRSYLMAIAVFVNGAKGHAALHLSRDLNVQ
jgi:hypothetical protein